MSNDRQKTSETAARRWRWGRFALIALPAIALFLIGAAVGSIWAMAVLAASLAIGLYIGTSDLTRPTFDGASGKHADIGRAEKEQMRLKTDNKTMFSEESLL